MSPLSDVQLLKHTLIQPPLQTSALPQLLVVVVQTLPVLPEFLQTILVDVVQHAGGTPRDLPSLLEAVCLAIAVRLGLAVHEIVIVGFASCTNEEGCGEERRRGGPDFLDLGDRIGERSRVDEHLLVEAVGADQGQSQFKWLLSAYRGFLAAILVLSRPQWL